MKSYAKAVVTVFLAVSLILSLINMPVTVTGESKLIKTTDTVALGADPRENFYKLTKAIWETDRTHLRTIKIEKSGKYPIGSDGSAIMLRSNMILDLNGSTLIRSGSMDNLFQNEDFDGIRDNGGYNQTFNFTIKNGTLDGKGGTEDEMNLVNLGHANNITISDIDFKNCRNGHLIELSGCKDVCIKKCTFTGFKGDGKNKDYSVKEAIQLDICHRANAKWNGVYKLDDTVCKNITVRDCVFKDYPSGVGNHHSLVGTKNHNTNIKIINNKFTNTLSKKGYAIWCFCFEKSLVSGNVISGNYDTAIRVSAGSGTVSGNKVSGVSYLPLYVSKASSNVLQHRDDRKEESAVSCKIKNNEFATKGKYDAVNIFSGSKISEFSGNKLSSKYKSAVLCSGKGTYIKTLKENNITNAGEYGIAVAGEAKIDTVSKNVIKGKKSGVRVTSKSRIKNISTNTEITSSSGDGIFISGAQVTNIVKNKVKNCGANGIIASSTGKVGKIQGNTVSGNKGYGICVNNEKITVSIGQNKCSSNKAGKEKIKARIKRLGTYTVKYNLSGGTNDKSNPKSYTSATPDIVLKKPARKGFLFKGWYSDAKYKNKLTVIKKGSKGNITLYAKWAKK